MALNVHFPLELNVLLIGYLCFIYFPNGNLLYMDSSGHFPSWVKLQVSAAALPRPHRPWWQGSLSLQKLYWAPHFRYSQATADYWRKQLVQHIWTSAEEELHKRALRRGGKGQGLSTVTHNISLGIPPSLSSSCRRLHPKWLGSSDT